MAKKRGHQGTLPGTRELDGFVSLSEATRTEGSKGIAEAVIIRHGFNASGRRFYPADVLKRDHGIFEGVQMFADHPSRAESRDRPERSVRDVVGVLEKVRVDEAGDVFGRPRVFAPWMKETLENMDEHQALDALGLSINAVGKTRKAEIDSRKTEMVEALTAANSVDFVTQAGAGGAIRMYESDDGETDMDIKELTLEQFVESRPDLVAELQKGPHAMTDEEVKTQVTEAVAAAVEPLQKTLETTTKERDEANAKIAESEKEIGRAKAQDDIAKLVKEADPALPPKAQEKLLDVFKEADSVEGVAEAIVLERDYIANFTPAGQVNDLGPGGGNGGATNDGFTKAVARYMREGKSEADAKLMAHEAGWTE